MSTTTLEKLTAVTVDRVFRSCLHDKERDQLTVEQIKSAVYAEGIRMTVGFDPARLRVVTEAIHTLIDQLPSEFANGWTFLNLCADKDGQLWTGMHEHCEQLMLLGLAIGRIQYCAPREFWHLMPGGVPYLQVLPRETLRGDREAGAV